MGAVKLQVNTPQPSLGVGEIVIKKCLVCSNFVTELFHFTLNDKIYAVCGMECGIKQASTDLAEIILKKPKSETLSVVKA